MPKTPSSNSKVVLWLKKAISLSSRSQTSSNPSETTNGQGLDTSPSRPHVHDAPDAVEYDASRLLSPGDRSDQERTLRTQPSRESARPTISTTRSKHERHPSIGRQKPAVRLLGQEQAAAPPGMTRLKASQTFCTLIVAYYQSQAARIEVARIEDAIVEYEEETAFDELGAIATEELTKHTGRPAEAFYLKVGRFRLVRHDSHKVASRGILESKQEWDEYLPWKIPEFLGQNRNVPFHIEIEWEYSSLQIEQVPGQSYAETIGTAIEGKIQENWEGRKYVPQKDLEKILTKDTVSKLIREDETLYSAKIFTLTGGTKLDVDEFIEDIWLWGTRLLALCVYTDLPLLCLYHMWLNGLRDKDLPLTKSHCPDPFYRRKFDMAVTISGGFAAHTFAPNEKGELEHVQLQPGAVVPILFDKADSKHILGKGSFGKVYRVRIDRDHHSFSAFEEEAFAFKIFYDLSAHTQMNVENESGTLARLAEAPHLNITTHLASWNQNGICYMLFRCADCNLRTYMSQKSPAWTKSNLLALLSQMRGLADGLRHIHNLGPSNLEPDRVNEKAKQGERHPSQSCFHHDLKPGNILVTTNPDTEHLLFSISDFGSAKIGQILSGSIQPSPFTKNLSPGDAVYGAPDAVLEGKTSRPYDLWSMGCIFLELLTWIVGLEEHNVERFADKRMEEVANAYGNQDQAFWYQDTTGRVLLKPTVVQQLKILKKTCEGRGVFPLLVRIVGKLLSILPRDRPEASQLFNDLDAIMTQVRLDLKDENFYINNMPTEVRIAAPPSSVGDSDDLSRRPSIDERAIIARYGDNLSPGPRANRRSTVGTAQPTVGQRTSIHARHQSTPEADADPQYLVPLDIDTRVEPSSPTNGDEIPNTPRISLSDFDNGPARTEALLYMGRGDESLPPIGSHNANFAPGLQKTISSDSQVFISE
jgi:serine/threonine protein kinase